MTFGTICNSSKAARDLLATIDADTSNLDVALSSVVTAIEAVETDVEAVNTTLGSPAQSGEAASATSALALESGGNLADIKTAVESKSTPTSIGDGSKDVATAGTAETLATTTTIKSVTVQAKNSNTGVIYVGGSTVSSTSGISLYAGDSVNMEIDDLVKIYVDSSVDGEGVVYTYVA
jgi:hypothetical protein